MSNPIAADAWARGRWQVEWSEWPSGDLDLLWSRRHPARCLWCGKELQSTDSKARKAFIERHSHSDFPDLPDLPDWHRRMRPMKTRQRVDLDLIDDNPWQPRTFMDPESLRELAEDIGSNTLLQTPLARPRPDAAGRYQLAFGHRRVAACRLLREQGKWFDAIDLDVEELSDERMIVIALAENTQRRQLSDIEVARAHRRALNDTGMPVQALADKLGLDRSTLSNNLRVLALPDFVLEHVESGEMSMAAAREFLALQNEDHAHIEDMQAVVRDIVRVYGSRGRPDWTRSHVREVIHLRVAYNDRDWRPLGPVPPFYVTGEAKREPGFDVEAFKSEFPHQVHNLPDVSKSEEINFEVRRTFSASRLWTCQVKEWSRRESAATRERNRADPETQAVNEERRESKEANDEASQLGEYLARDPVWKAIAARREEKGPYRPVTDEERKALGTRASIKDRSGFNNSEFWKLLRKPDPDDRPGWWSSNLGGPVPPYFPLDGCGGCVKGASYVRPRIYGRDAKRLELACVNRSCYKRKLAEGAAGVTPEIEEGKAEIARQDEAAVKTLRSSLAVVYTPLVRAMAVTLVESIEKFEMAHPYGEYLDEWSYESGVTARVWELLGGRKRDYTNGNHSFSYREREDMVSLVEALPDSDLRELLANLLAYRLRRSGRIDGVHRETDG